MTVPTSSQRIMRSHKNRFQVIKTSLLPSLLNFSRRIYFLHSLQFLLTEREGGRASLLETDKQ